MYKLGEQFVFDYEQAKPNPECVVQGKTYRITVLSEALVRLEYNADGKFEDRPTKLVYRRYFDKPEFKLREDSNYLEITTKYFKLDYKKEKPFFGGKVAPSANLGIMLPRNEKTWYYQHPEVRNYGTPDNVLLDHRDKYKFTKGLFSHDGFASIDDSNSEIIDEGGAFVDREVETIDVYVFVYDKDFQKCLQDYFALTGAPALIPRYALGNWWSKNTKYDDHSLRELIDQFDFQDIPLSVVLLNHDWYIRNYYKKKKLETGFTFNEDCFKAPMNMIRFLHSKGIRVGLSVNPIEGFYPTEKNFESITKYLQVDKNGIVPFSVIEPKVLDVYLKVLIHYLDAMEVDFYWLNMEQQTDKKQMHAEKFYLNHYHFYDMKRNYKRRPMILAENTDVAPHRYPVLYSGKTKVDWKTLKAIPFFNVSATNKGVSWWAHDIGGFHQGIEEDELYIRFVQLGVFSPILKFGSDDGRFYKREPWRWGINVYNITKEYLRLRHRLIPYLYSEAYKYHTQGRPLLKPIYYQYPEMHEDSIYRNEYYFGSELFVCPIINKKEEIMKRTIHHFYMPEGVWYDFYSGKRFPGPDSYVSFFKEEQYPVFAQAGSIIPFGENDNIFDTTPPKNMEIHVFPGKSNNYELYEDDGMTDLHRKGFYLKTMIEYNYMPSNYTLILRPLEGKSGIVPPQRNYTIRFRNTRKTDDVTAYVKDNKVECSTYVENNDFIVVVNNISTTTQLTINCKGEDIEIDALHIINDDIYGIINDIFIETHLKQAVYDILFSDLPIPKKRIAVRKLRRQKLEPKFIKLFLKLLEYIDQV